MFLEGVKSSKILKKEETRDTTMLGDLEIPAIGVGTISWSSKSRECKNTGFSLI